MSGGDRTGPLGQGPGTGRALGYCYGFDTPGYTRGRGRGFGFGRGFGHGRGNGRKWNIGGPYQGDIPGNAWMPPTSKEDEIKMLKSEADALKRSQKEIEKRLGELEKEE